MSSKPKGQTVLIPKYKRANRGKDAEAQELIDSVDATPYMEMLLPPDEFAQYQLQLFQINWEGKFYEVKAIVDESPDPLHDRKCWGRLGAYYPAEDRAKLVSPQNIKTYSTKSLYMKQYLTMCRYTPNEMNIQELAAYALQALCLPTKAQVGAQLLWAKMLDLFQGMDLHVMVAKHLTSGVNEKEGKFKLTYHGEVDARDFAANVQEGKSPSGKKK